MLKTGLILKKIKVSGRMPKLRLLFKAEGSSEVKLWENKLVITLSKPVILRFKKFSQK